MCIYNKHSPVCVCMCDSLCMCLYLIIYVVKFPLLKIYSSPLIRIIKLRQEICWFKSINTFNLATRSTRIVSPSDLLSTIFFFLSAYVLNGEKSDSSDDQPQNDVTTNFSLFDTIKEGTGREIKTSNRYIYPSKGDLFFCFVFCY